jgi:hypothetical protein
MTNKPSHAESIFLALTYYIPLAMRVESAKKRASSSLCVEAFFCLDFLFLFHLRKKKEERLSKVI